MKITIEVLDSGHLIEVEKDGEIEKHCAGKWHSVSGILRRYLYKPDPDLGRPKKQVSNIEKCLDR